MNDLPPHANDPLNTAALLAQTGQTHGEPPTASELQAWAAHTLPATRRKEIDSHVAHNPAIFEQAMRRLDQHKRQAARRRPVFALAATALIALVGAGFLLGPGTAPPADRQSVERSARQPAADWRATAFAAGVEAVTDFDPQSLNLRDCIDGDLCPDLAHALYRYGATLTTLEANCARQIGPSQEQVDRLRAELITFRRSFELAPWSAPLGRVLDAATAPDCTDVQALLNAPTGAH